VILHAERALPAHPFTTRNIHPAFPSIVRELFDNGHYAQAAFEAFKFIDKEVQQHSRSKETGFKLMLQAFGGNPPSVSLTKLSTMTEEGEQKRFQFLLRVHLRLEILAGMRTRLRMILTFA
jgi:uncharacterized protein (TIGR02391 family)